MAPPALPLREYPITVGTLAWILGPLVTLLVSVAGITWSKIDHQGEQLADLRVGQAKLESVVVRQNELLTEISQAIRSTR